MEDTNIQRQICEIALAMLQARGDPIDEIEHFFVSYNAARGKKFKPTARNGPAVAERPIRKQTKKRK